MSNLKLLSLDSRFKVFVVRALMRLLDRTNVLGMTNAEQAVYDDGKELIEDLLKGTGIKS